ncbi:iron-sulfur cluster repair di-iron protein [Aquibacillus sediminis]|uniref:iron-sulfur cluster repair di-iron protein n=1 Tax=Aquibacillus sediminis TaxID=2574734 RepID=UPI00110958CA|nr:iron-sulfur cluster repair di-iron protein [Aquibacillus sediminis]
MTTFTKEHTPAEIVKTFPKAADLFKQFKIDFCCGGDKPLHQVFEKKTELDGEQVLEQLNSFYSEWIDKGNVGTDWDTVTSSELIDHIIERHHNYLHEELPALEQFVVKIARVHGGNHPHLLELQMLYDHFKADMEAHLAEEETEVFPKIREYEKNPNPELLQTINELNDDMESEHQATGDLLSQMNELTNDFNPPADACNSYRITYARLAELEANTFDHIHLENNILFKKLA